MQVCHRSFCFESKFCIGIVQLAQRIVSALWNIKVTVNQSVANLYTFI